MKIKSVTIEGMRNVKRKTYTFNSNVTYLQGPNGSGKSTVLNAIQLALLGYIPGTAKSNSAIMAHANCPELRVSVDLVKDDESEVTVTRSFKKKGTGSTSSVSIDPSDADIDDILGDSKLPIFDWVEFTNLTSNKMKDWFIQFIPGMNQKVDWEHELSSTVSDIRYNKNIVKEYVKKISTIQSESSVDEVTEANKILKSDLSYSKAALAEKENTINGYFDYNSSDIEDVDTLSALKDKYTNEVENVERKYFDARNEWSKADHIKSDQESAISLYNTLSKDNITDREMDDLKNRLSDLQRQKDSILDKNVTLKSKYEHVMDSLQELSNEKYKIVNEVSSLSKLVQSKGTCPYTNVDCDYLTSMNSKNKEKLDDLNSKLDNVSIEEKSMQDAKKEIQESISKNTSELQKIQQEYCTIESSIGNYERLRKKLSDLKIPDEKDIITSEYVEDKKNVMERYRKQVMELKEKISDIDKSIESSKMIDQMTIDKYGLEEKVAILNSWVKLTSANGLQTTLSSGGFKDLEDNLDYDVKKLFGEKVTCKFNVSNKANSFSFGIDRNGTYIPYNLLSTGEKTLYTFALMSYIAKHSNSDIRLVMMDDFFDHLDSVKFDMLLNVMSEDSEDVQIIMAGVVPCYSDDFVEVVTV